MNNYKIGDIVEAQIRYNGVTIGKEYLVLARTDNEMTEDYNSITICTDLGEIKSFSPQDFTYKCSLARVSE